jgi:phospholipase/carboxylesterase
MIVLHGWGGNAQELASVVPFLNLPDYLFLLPNATFPHPYAASGRAWYDFQKHVGLTESQQLLKDWLLSLESTTNVPLSRTFLSGFSQGGAMTLDIGLNLPLAGLICMSGYLHPITPPPQEHQYPPVLVVHGRQDSIVPLSAAHKTRDTLSSLGVQVEYQEFEMGHEVRPEVLTVIQNFVKTHS